MVMQATQGEKITAQMAFFFLVSFVQRVLCSLCVLCLTLLAFSFCFVMGFFRVGADWLAPFVHSFIGFPAKCERFPLRTILRRN